MNTSEPESPGAISPAILPTEMLEPEVSMVEASEVTGVSFTPELWMQRRRWALQVLRKEGARSVLDVGCGTGALLETLVIPPTTIFEPPIRSRHRSPQPDQHQLPSPADSGSDDEEDEDRKELFLTRLGGLDTSPSILPSALSLLSPHIPESSSSITTAIQVPPSNSPFPSSSKPVIVPYVSGTRPRWEPLTTELYLGGIERYNSKLEDYDAIVMLEVIEHLEPSVLSRFGVVTLGTYRPRLLLVTTPNFDFNAKFPRVEEEGFARKGFADPTGRTDRVFRHSDHKVEMTSEEFRSWAESSAADWGYSVEISGVGISSIPSYYPPINPNDPLEPKRPIYATQTAIFRLASGLPLRSPRSVRSVELPFMPSSRESTHPHKVVGKFVHPISAPGIEPPSPEGTPGGSKSKWKGKSGKGEKEKDRPLPPADIREVVKRYFENWKTPKVSLDELWAMEEVCGGCKGSKRYLVGCLGGYGDCPAVKEVDGSEVGVSSGTGVTGAVGNWLNNARTAVAGSKLPLGEKKDKNAHVAKVGEFKVVQEKGRGLMIEWKGFVDDKGQEKDGEDEGWGMKGLDLGSTDTTKTGGW